MNRTAKDHASSKLFLWDKRTLYIGPLKEAISLSNGAATLIIALDGEMTISNKKDGSPAITCRSLLIPPGEQVTIDPGKTIIANCYLDAMGEDLHCLSSLANHKYGKGGYCLDNENELIKTILPIYENTTSYNEAYDVLESCLNYSSPSKSKDKFSVLKKKYKRDKRVERIIEIIKSQIDNNLSLHDLSEEVGLSAPRLMQIFKQQTGIPIRRYRLWHRLYVTGEKLSQGMSLTQAALSSGFTDSAHLSNTFKDMLGMSPRSILTQSHGLKIFINNNQLPNINR
ncbi:MAG: AraC-like DNA-binding protein [Psychrobacter glaciei]|jgi:AraC-like DNA-binding protein